MMVIFMMTVMGKCGRFLFLFNLVQLPDCFWFGVGFKVRNVELRVQWVGEIRVNLYFEFLSFLDIL